MRRRGADPGARPALGARRDAGAPRRATEAIGVGLRDNGTSLLEPPFELTAPTAEWARAEVVTAPRIGISQGVEHPWRFCAAGSRFLSRPLARAREAEPG